MDFPEDLGKRIVAAARLAVLLHVQRDAIEQLIPGGTGFPIDGVELFGGAAMDGGAKTPSSAQYRAGAPGEGNAFSGAGGARDSEREAA
jgi:hypothetical protein